MKAIKFVKKRNPNWSRDELIFAFNLYCKTPFGKIHNRNPEIIKLAGIIGRTPSALSYKLANFSRLDPNLQKRNIKGASHGSKEEEVIWNEFNNNWENLAYESEILFAKYNKLTIEKFAHIPEEELPKEGKERERIVKVRVNQNFFRSTILATYEYKCAITGIAIPDLLNASHIVPWSKDEKNRLNPRNGICLNALHDRAYDRGLITILPDYVIKLSAKLKKELNAQLISKYFLEFSDQKINLPKKFLPDQNFLMYHNKHIFQK